MRWDKGEKRAGWKDALDVHSDAQLAGGGEVAKVGNRAGLSMIAMRHLHLT